MQRLCSDLWFGSVTFQRANDTYFIDQVNFAPIEQNYRTCTCMYE